MNIEDCEVGMKVEPLKEFGKIHKDGLKIHSINPGRKLISIRNGCFVSSDHNPEYFEPFNKFEVGDEVLYRYFHGKICNKVRYCGEDSKGNPIIEYDNGYVTNNIDYSELSPLKKPNELEVGDKFKNIAKYEIKVLEKEYDKLNNEMVYFGKCENGLVSVWSEYEVQEIIYD